GRGGGRGAPACRARSAALRSPPRSVARRYFCSLARSRCATPLRCSAAEAQRGVLVMKQFSWPWILAAVLLLGGLLGYLYLDHWTSQACTRRGKARIQAKEYSQAIDDFSAAVRLDPKNAVAYHGRGVAYLHLGEHGRAIMDFSEAMWLDPSDAGAPHNRGVAYYHKQDYDRALADLGEAIRLNPSFTEAYLARSRVYAKRGEDARARTDLQKPAELDRSLEKPG